MTVEHIPTMQQAASAAAYMPKSSMLPLLAGLAAAGVATYFAIYAKPAEDPDSKAKSIGQEIHDKLAKAGQVVAKDAKIVVADTSKFFKGDYNQAINKALDHAKAGVVAVAQKDEATIADARKKADDKIDASKIPPAVKAVAKFGVNVGTNVAKDAVIAGAAIAKAGVTVAHDATVVAQHAGADIGHVGVAIGDLFKHPSNIGHDLAPIADDFKHLLQDIKDVFHPHIAAKNKITKMQQQYDGARRDRETAAASNAIQADVTARNVPVTAVQAALTAGAVAHVAAAMAADTNARISSHYRDKSNGDDVDAVAAIYQESDSTLQAAAAAVWAGSADYKLTAAVSTK